MCIKWAAPVTRGKPRKGSLGVTNKAHLPETARPTTHEHAAARSHFFLSFFRDSTISATRCAREFPIKTAYNGACLWAHVYWVHTILICIMKVTTKTCFQKCRKVPARPPPDFDAEQKKKRAHKFAAIAASAHLMWCPRASEHWRGTIFACTVQGGRV